MKSVEERENHKTKPKILCAVKNFVSFTNPRISWGKTKLSRNHLRSTSVRITNV